MPIAPSLLALSDLHVRYRENRELIEQLRPGSPEDWLLVPGDVAEYAAEVEWALRQLSEHFAKVIWAPGNHELWTPKEDPVQLRGSERYQYLVELCRSLGVVTPEDPYPVWSGNDGPVRIVPMFLLYDYTFRPEGATSKEEGLQIARNSGIVCTDEVFLHPDPYPSRDAWCQERVAQTQARLDHECDDELPIVFINHYPLVREPTRVLRYPEFAQWCGTELTADWHTRYDTAVMVYGHLHIPRTTWHDGVRFEEVSLGYPREWKRRPNGPARPRQILPARRHPV